MRMRIYRILGGEGIGGKVLGEDKMRLSLVLCDLLDLVEQMNIQIASHIHASSPPPNNAASFTAASALAKNLTSYMKNITL